MNENGTDFSIFLVGNPHWNETNQWIFMNNPSDRQIRIRSDKYFLSFFTTGYEHLTKSELLASQHTLQKRKGFSVWHLTTSSAESSVQFFV